MLTAESEANLRRARTEAKWELRHCRREFGEYPSRYILDDLQMTGWLTERIRVEGASLPVEHLAAMHAQLLRKLAFTELIVTNLWLRSSAVGEGSS